MFYLPYIFYFIEWALDIYFEIYIQFCFGNVIKNMSLFKLSKSENEIFRRVSQNKTRMHLPLPLKNEVNGLLYKAATK